MIIHADVSGYFKKKMRISITSILLFFTLLSYGQIKDYERIDSIVRFIPISSEVGIDNLPMIVTKPFKTNLEKICAIYCWMAQNIEYDYVGFKNRSWEKYLSDTALLTDTYKYRKGICSGYSHLFKFFLSKLEIQSVVLNGYGRGDLKTLSLNTSNHAWNAVLIGKDWKLFDVTWARDTTTKKTDFFWFMTRPELFIASHYPNDNKWTLLQKQIALKSFLSFPIVTPKYFELGFNETFPTKGIIEKTKGTNLRIYLRPNMECLFLPRVYNLKNREKIQVEYKVAKDNSYIDFNFLATGEYSVSYSVLIQDENHAVIYSNVMIYKVIIK
jgi:transglutaminase/protease-like cytokinesis protein 3